MFCGFPSSVLQTPQQQEAEWQTAMLRLGQAHNQQELQQLQQNSYIFTTTQSPDNSSDPLLLIEEEA